MPPTKHKMRSTGENKGRVHQSACVRAWEGEGGPCMHEAPGSLSREVHLRCCCILSRQHSMGSEVE